jgi:two-component system, NtrC family, response regulator AtoC
VLTLVVPPLRERGEDVLVLTDHFLRRFGARYERRITGLEPRVREIFLTYAWPGNVRELENLLERIFILEEEDTVLVRHLPARILRQVGAAEAQPQQGIVPAADLPASAQRDLASDFHSATDAFHKDLIRRALMLASGNQTSAAARLGLTRHALRHYIRKLDIR